jgi:hypothetical protein
MVARTRRTYKKRGGATNNAQMKWIFDEDCVVKLLSIMNETYDASMETNVERDLRKKIRPFYFEGFGDSLEYGSNRIQLSGNIEGMTDSCEFILNSASGNISFRSEKPEPREYIPTPEWWSGNKQFPQPPKENMWIKHSKAIISQLMRCRKQISSMINSSGGF